MHFPTQEGPSLDLQALIDELVASEADKQKQINDDHELALILMDKHGGTAAQKTVHKDMKKRAAAATKALKEAAKVASKLVTKSSKTSYTRKGQGAMKKGGGATPLAAYHRQRAETFAQKGKVRVCVQSSAGHTLNAAQAAAATHRKVEKITIAIVYFTPSKVSWTPGRSNCSTTDT